MERLKVTLVQADLTWENPEVNLNHLDHLLAKVEEETDLIVLPEMFTTGFSMNAKVLAERPSGLAVQWLQKKALEFDATLMGSVIIFAGERFYNRLYCVSPSGEIQHYDKKYLFTLGGEKEHYSSGKNLIMVHVKGWKICPLVCYDLRFPEWSRNNSGYDMLIYVANWPMTRIDHWCTLLKARAIENQAYAVGVNRVGLDANDLYYSGHSSVYDFNGGQLLEEKHHEIVKTIHLYKKPLLLFRENLPFLHDQESFHSQDDVLDLV